MRYAPRLLAGIICSSAATIAWTANPILGEVEIKAASRLERDAGLWVDGQYLGYVRELQGRGKLVLVPGEHQLLFKLIGYQDVAGSIVVDPGERTLYRLRMLEAPDITYPDKAQTARLRVSVDPDDAAVFVNGAYIGHVDQFDDRKGLRLGPGSYKFTIALPGYQSFETELSVRAGQSYEISTELLKGNFNDQAGVLSAEASNDKAAE
jgi:hypothetical protein